MDGFYGPQTSFRIVKDRGSIHISNHYISQDHHTLSTHGPEVLPQVPALVSEGFNEHPGYASDAFGYRSTSSGFASIAHGKESIARLRTQITHAGGSFIFPGDVQHSKTILKARHVETTIADFKLDDIEEFVVHGKATSILLKIKVFGSAEDLMRSCYYAKLNGLVKTFDDEPKIRLEQVKKKVKFGPSTWDVNMKIVEDQQNFIRITALVADDDIPGDIRWLATIESFEHYHD